MISRDENKVSKNALRSSQNVTQFSVYLTPSITQINTKNAYHTHFITHRQSTVKMAFPSSVSKQSILSLYRKFLETGSRCVWEVECGKSFCVNVEYVL